MTKEGLIEVALWSGGKDSTVMIDKHLRGGGRFNHIIFSDTQLEFTEMYEYLCKIMGYWEERYNQKVIILEANKNFKDLILNVRGENGRPLKNEENRGKISGLLNPTAQFCEWRTESKIRPYERWLRKNGLTEDDVLVYVGFTLDEPNRLKKHKQERYLLVEWKMTERDCIEYCKEYEMENPLYRYFLRTGCRLCPYQSEYDFYHIWKFFPGVWEEFKYYERLVKEHPREAISSNWFANFKMTEDMEKIFQSYLDLGIEPMKEPLKNCLCKI